MSLTVSVDVKQHYTEPCFGIGHSLSLICQPTSEDMKLYFIIIQKTFDMSAVSLLESVQ